MANKEIADLVYNHGDVIGRRVGFKDLTKVHAEWMRNIAFGDGDYTLMAHRGAFKSSCLSVSIALMMVFFPTKNIIFLRKADTDVSEMISMVRKALQSDIIKDIARAVYGIELTITESASDKLSTNLWTSPMGSPQLLGLGIKSSITGKHAEFVITDDICNVSDRISKAERDRTKLQYQELQNIRNRGGRIINLGTKWHKDDVFTLMPNIKVYDWKSTGLISEEQIERIRESMTASLFACNYELRVIAEDDIIFTNPQRSSEVHMVEQGISHIDAAYGGEDYSILTICNKHDGKYYVYGKMRHRHIDDVEDEYIALHQKFNSRHISCEDNGDKGYLARDLRQKGVKTLVYHESMNKYYKITSYLKGEWKNVVFVDGTDEEYIEQILDYNENAEHDDAPDSLASAIRELWNKKERKDEDIAHLFMLY